MLPLVLAPAAIIAFAQSPAAQGPMIQGLVLNQAGKPLPASIGAIPMFQRDEPFPSRTVENRTVKAKKANPGFALRVPSPGLYVLDIRGRGCRPLQVPLLVGEEGLKDLEITPTPLKLQGEAKPVGSDPKLVKLAAMYAAQKDREASYQKAIKARMGQKSGASAEVPTFDWTADLEAIAETLKNDEDPEVRSLAAICYLELHTMMTDVVPETAGKALDELPATSSWWAFSPRSVRGAFTAADRADAWAPFIEALSNENPDREVRAYGLYSQTASAYYKGNREKFNALSNTLATEYKGTKYAKSAKIFDPAKMPPASAAPSEEIPPAVPETAPTPSQP